MKCENCNKRHDGSYGSGRFCSSKCARGFSTKKNRKEINKKVSVSMGGTGELKTLKPCLNCGKQTFNDKFCSNKCQGELQIKQYEEKVEKLGYFPNMTAYDTGGHTGKIKRFLIKRHGRKCTICGNTKWQNKPIPLWLDHIDGHANNFKIDNLRLICPNCDALSDTYCGKNKGNGSRKFVKVCKTDP